MLKYIGKACLPGVPARDLTTAEVKLYGKDKLLASGLYLEKQPPKTAVKEVDDGKWDQSIKTDSDI
jgi:hypothetical protein